MTSPRGSDISTPDVNSLNENPSLIALGKLTHTNPRALASDGRTDRRTDHGRITDGRKDGTDGQTDGRTDGRDGRTDGGLMDGQTEGRMAAASADASLGLDGRMGGGGPNGALLVRPGTPATSPRNTLF